MINLFDKSRTPNYNNEILTKSFLIDKIANDMKMKYKKVFSLINYDEYTLKNDIHSLLSKYISNKNKEINIKYIETTILNKVRQKYKVLKTPLNPVNKKNNLIKIISSSPNSANTYLNINKSSKLISSKKNKKYLSPIKNNINTKNNEIEEIINQNYYTNQENKISNNENIINNNENSEINQKNKNDEIINENNDENNKIKQYKEEDEKIKKDILEEEEEIKVLEKYRQNIQNQINEINEEIKNQEKIKDINEQLININKDYENLNEEIQENKEYNSNNSNDKEIKNEQNDNIYKYDPSMTYEQKQYLERKKRIEEDFYDKQNRYIFLKPKKEVKEEENLNNNIYMQDNIKINKYSMDKLNEFYKIKEKIKQEKEKKEKEKEYRNKSAKNIYEFKENNEENKSKNKQKEIFKNASYNDKIQLKVLQRSIDQERAIEHLRNILYPKKLIEESEYQGFIKNVADEKQLKKKREYELADQARRIQLEKMKKSLDNSIGDKKRIKYEEEEIEKKYREMYEKEHELYLEKEKQKKLEKDKKLEEYRRGLEEQIQEKNKILLDDDNNFLEINKDLGFVE